ncbi:MAG: hypothetical protein K2N48_06570 [Muribaculaceae bacterium]|nr:hypothetical protein [Muribaculaceae bacterium]
MKNKEKELKSETDSNVVKAGMLTLGNVSVQETGRSLFSLYHDKRKRVIEPFADMVRQGLLKASSSSTAKMQSTVRELRQPNGAANLTEPLQTQLYNSFYGNLKNVLAVAKADRRYDKAWKRLITSLEVGTFELREQLGREVRIEYGHNWGCVIFPELLFSHLTVTKTWETYSRDFRSYSIHGNLSMDALTRVRLSDLFFGKESRIPHLIGKLPDEMSLKVEDFEQDTPTDLIALKGISLNGSILSDNGSISATAVRKVKGQTNIRDFNITSGQWLPDRVEMLCLTYFTMLSDKASKTDIDILRLTRFAVDTMPGMITGPMFNTFIPALQGFTKTWTSGSYAPRVAGAAQHLLREAAGQWMSLDNFRMRLLCSDIEGNANYTYLNLFSAAGRDKARIVRRSDKEHESNTRQIVMPIEWFDEVGLKFALHWLKYLCALGMVEIAMDTAPRSPESDPMEGMRFARLTPLGRYALRIDSTYTPKAAASDCSLEFDSRNCIFTLDPKSPFQMFLANVARRISPTRFHISAETLVKGCTKREDLEKRIKNLKVIVDPDKEPALQKIIDDAQRQTACAVRDGGYTLLKLRSDLPGLREVILTDRELRAMTILAGATLAFVKTHKMERFNAICASYGFLME